jgi:transcriptional regulator with XRE-family HTH domain
MSQDPLLSQIAERCRTFSAGTGVSLNKIARMIGVEPGNFSAFVNGRIGLSAASTLKLLQLLNLTKRQVEEKLAVKAVKIAHFQQEGKPMRLSNDGWVAGVGPDPNDGDITSVKTARDLDNADDYQQETIDFLKAQQNIHRSAIVEIQKYLDNAGKSKINQGSTEPPRRINDNTRSQTPGPKPDQFSRR